MYLPAAFRVDDPESQFGLIRECPLGLLVCSGPAGLLANWIPFLAYPGEGEKGVLRAHVARANAQWQELRSVSECLVVFQGPQAYISPNWYPTKGETHKVVPTWNYATVQVWGRPAVQEDSRWIRRQVDDLTRQQEANQPRPWSLAEAPEDFAAAQLRAIVGIEIAITRTEGKWKMSQNRNPADRDGAMAGLRGDGGAEQRAVADLIGRNPPR
jgi:transcriptional regulator